MKKSIEKDSEEMSCEDNGYTTFKEVRRIVKERNISEQQFLKWLIKEDAGQSPKEILELITNHIYHSSEEHLVAPPHLRNIKNCQCPHK